MWLFIRVSIYTTSTVVDRDLLEFDQLGQPGAALDDEVETTSQRFQRLLLQATDGEAAALATEGSTAMFYTLHTEQLHLERINLVNTDPMLQAEVNDSFPPLSLSLSLPSVSPSAPSLQLPYPSK